MDVAAVLWAVLGVVLLLLLPGTAWLLTAPGRRPRGRPRTPPARVPGPAFVDDDLPAFRAAPPGTPGAALSPTATRVRLAPEPAGGPDGARSTGRVLLAMTAAALVLLGALAVIAGVTRGAATDDDRPAADPTAPTSTRPVPELLPVPPAPAPGDPGAGHLAALSVPLDAGGWAGRLALAPLVLERRAVGTTVTIPAVSVTRRTDGTALAHVRLPTWNCLAGEAPADPATAGCAPGPVEYADLPSPALVTEVGDDELRLSGRFPTYTRPNGGPPVYTGRVYELTVSLRAEEPAGPGSWAPARGTLFLGTDRAESLPDPGLSAVLRTG